ncbi:MinD/ParA family ATP-binding protein [Microbacterium saperdae]
MMSGPHEEATPGADARRRDDRAPLVESVPLFPTDAPAVPPRPTTTPAPPAQPPYRRTRADARVDRAPDIAAPPRPLPPTPVASPAVPSSPPPLAAPETAPTDTVPRRPAAPSIPTPTAPVPRMPSPPTPGAQTPMSTASSASTSPAPASSAPTFIEPASRREQRVRERDSFLQTERPEEPAREGARGALNRLGLRIRPSADEQSARDDELAVSQHWPGPRTIAVVNGKGGAGKTPTTVLLSAVFARYGGAGVLAWDNNQTRGTLGWRTDTGAHDRTLLELLPEAGRLLGTGAQSADLAHFMHHQPREKYDVLRSKPIRLAHENRLSPTDVDAIHAVASKFYRLIVIDSGNDESDPMWLRMIDHADQLVIATTTRADHAEAGALLIEALEERDERSARLARESVAVVSQADPKATAAELDHVTSGYRSLSREVVSIPFDHEMVDGPLRYGALNKRTQRAWLSAAAAVARGF